MSHLLTGLLKRDADDRMDFDEFFHHPFLREEEILTENFCDKNKHLKSVNKQGQHLKARINCLKDENVQYQKKQNCLQVETEIDNLKTELNQMGKKPNHLPLSNNNNNGSKIKNKDELTSNKYSQRHSSDDSSDLDDFVMINEDVIATTPQQTNIGITTESSLPQRIFDRTLRPLVNYALPEPLPVPTQRAAFEQMQRSSGSNSSSIGAIQESDSENGGSASNFLTTGNNRLIGSPPVTVPKNPYRNRMPNRAQQSAFPSPPNTLNLKRHDSSSSIGSVESNGSRSSRHMLATDVSQMSPPVNFVLGSSPVSPGSSGLMNLTSTNSNYRSRRLSIPHTNPYNHPQQNSPTYYN